MRIITSSMASKLAFAGETLGFSLPCAPDKSACLAYVFCQHVEQLAARSRVPLPRVLASAVAHEIGHLAAGAEFSLGAGHHARKVLWQQRGAVGFWGIWAEPSPDGRYLAIMTEMTDSNIWMIENF